MADYIKWLRSKVGHQQIITVALVAFLENENGEVLLQKRMDSGLWDLPGGVWNWVRRLKKLYVVKFMKKREVTILKFSNNLLPIIGETFPIQMGIKFNQ